MTRRPAGSQDIPSGQNLSPNEIDLPTLLALVEESAGYRTALNEAVRQEFYGERPIPARGQGRVWDNVVRGMVAYRLITPSAEFLPAGQALYELRNDPDRLYEAFGRHLLLHVSGVALIETLIDMNKAGEVISLPTIRVALEERGIYTSTAGKSVSLLRAWLAKAGLFRSQWTVDEERYRALLGVSVAEIESLANATPEQRAVLRLLADLGSGEHDSSELRRSAERRSGLTINEKQFSGAVLYPLEEAGFVELRKKGGRGWTLGVSATDRLVTEVLVPILEQMPGLPSELRRLQRMSLEEIVQRLDGDRHTKGLALEAFAFRLMRIAGLEYMGTRVRPRQGRFEVDLLFDARHPSYTRWQVQCKNTDAVSLDDVAKEVGLSYHLLTSVIVMITRGRIGEDARRYATDVMRKTNLSLVLIDRVDVDRIIERPLAVIEVLMREAMSAAAVKQIERAPTEI